MPAYTVFNEDLLHFLSTYRTITSSLIRKIQALQSHTDSYTDDARTTKGAEIILDLKAMLTYLGQNPLINGTEQWGGTNRTSPVAPTPTSESTTDQITPR